jgi:hypothetical protein
LPLAHFCKLLPSDSHVFQLPPLIRGRRQSQLAALFGVPQIFLDLVHAATTLKFTL